MYSHDLEVMNSNPGWVELGVLGTSALSRTNQKYLERCCIMFTPMPLMMTLLGIAAYEKYFKDTDVSLFFDAYTIPY